MTTQVWNGTEYVDVPDAVPAPDSGGANIFAGPTAPDDPAEGDLWIDTDEAAGGGASDLSAYSAESISLTATSTDVVIEGNTDVLLRTEGDNGEITIIASGGAAVASLKADTNVTVQATHDDNGDVDIKAGHAIAMTVLDDDTAVSAVNLTPAFAGMNCDAADAQVIIAAPGAGAMATLSCDAALHVTSTNGFAWVEGGDGVIVQGVLFAPTPPTVDSASPTLAADLAAILITMGLLAEAP